MRMLVTQLNYGSECEKQEKLKTLYSQYGDLECELEVLP